MSPRTPLQLILLFLLSIQLSFVIAKPTIPQHGVVRRAPTSTARYDTNAKRLAAGLPPLTPRRRFTPTRVGVAARAPSPILYSGYIRIADWVTNVPIGWVSKTTSSGRITLAGITLARKEAHSLGRTWTQYVWAPTYAGLPPLWNLFPGKKPGRTWTYLECPGILPVPWKCQVITPGQYLGATANRGERGIWTVGDYAIGDATIGKTTTDKSRFRSLQTQTYIVHDPGTWIHHPDSLAHYQSIGM
ncbi:hypothetical protein DFP72DRAFT_1045665 [Ephemerocybe angulata]|uniref:Uncharacterized protein n=1 Tax=Ephemerocybe angulata TaxID=980116 RepID=A0A8H6HY92_9AGAR|nr:hypothetical protein DFP72DRAFT_1045665 [Tulosesus angulatus]